MKKVSNITLGGVIFTVEEDAYGALSTYLDTIQRHFTSFAEREEIVADIESRIAEKFSAVLSSRKPAVSLADVEAVIQSMGTVADFADAVPAATAASEPTPGKRARLYRNMDDQIVGGVASGIAVYFGVNPLIVRLILFAMLFLGGLGLALYLVLWLIVPPANTDAEKLEMRGEPVTLAALEKQMKERIADVRGRNEGWLRRILSFPILVLKAVLGFLGKLVPIIARILGFAISLVAILASIALSAAFLTALFTPMDALGVDLSRILPALAYYTMLVTGYLVLFVPALGLLFLGKRLRKGRAVLSGSAATGLIVLWAAALSVAIAIGVRFAPRIRSELEAATARQTRTQDYVLAPATRIDSSGDLRITVLPGETFRVHARGPQDDLENLVLGSKDNELTITRKDASRFCFFCLAQPTELTIETPDLDAITVGGDSDLRIKGLSGDALAITTHRRVNVDADVRFQKLTVLSLGSAGLHLRGGAETLSLDMSGSSAVDALQLDAARATLRFSGSADVSLHARDELNVSITGSGLVRYTGDPKLSQDISGWGEIERIDALAEGN